MKRMIKADFFKFPERPNYSEEAKDFGDWYDEIDEAYFYGKGPRAGELEDNQTESDRVFRIIKKLDEYLGDEWEDIAESYDNASPEIQTRYRN